jgi:hypothetical protein
MGHVAAEIFRRSNERNRRIAEAQKQKSCCCCNCRKENRPKRFEAIYYNGAWAVLNHTSLAAIIAFDIPTREAAEEIAAVYERVMPFKNT